MDWKQLFNWRKGAKWFTWGKTSRHRVSSQEKETDQSIVVSNSPRFMGYCRPVKVGPVIPNQELLPEGGHSNPIGKLYMGGNLEGVLLLDHKLLTQGLPKPTMYSPIPMIPIRRETDNHNQEHEPIVHRLRFGPSTSSYPISTEGSSSPHSDGHHVTQEEEDFKISQASFGRYHISALDFNNNIIIGQLPRGNRVIYTKVIPPTQFKGRILKVAAGWGCDNAVLIDNIGLIIFDNNDFKKWALISGPENPQVVDFVLGEDFLVYLDNKGRLFSVDLKLLPESLSVTPLSNIQKTFNDLSKPTTHNRLTTPPSIIRLNGWFRRFAAYDDDGHIVIAERTNEEDHKNGLNEFTPVVHDILQNNGCTSIAFGDHHTMALISDKIFVWGAESQECGCFGLGRRDEVLALEGSSRTRGGLQLSKPTHVPTDGYVVAIAAGGWQSAALIVNSPPPI